MIRQVRVCTAYHGTLAQELRLFLLEGAQDDVADGEAGLAHALRHEKSVVFCRFVAVDSYELVLTTRFDALL